MKEDVPINTELKKRRTLLAGVGIFSIIALLKVWGLKRTRETIECGPADANKTQKLLSQDGQLVEVDVSRLRVLKKDISDEELQKWVRRK
jgi:hypothetical protein